ncbi:MAG TPA: AgmX/PglI C-terminal domain-containing protein [Myxococcota bacterium]|nr:AgmX/PglI C-terminal domain-containing protein [Myxococcota bacterium]HRY93636.1 AgmX/PglI C-terminal domain-containing protein [Myxococcota bacterium]HSA23344.1 AgmX/PglI C-terminal domain-containing protein [Myxococcota bacterium]
MGPASKLGLCGVLLAVVSLAGTARAADLPDVRVSLGKLTVMGSLDKAIIRRIMLRRQPELRACYLDALHKKPSLAGRLDLRFIIHAAGHVSHTEARGGELARTGLARCVVARVEGWRFHGGCKGGGIVIVDAPIWFEVARSEPGKP